MLTFKGRSETVLLTDWSNQKSASCRVKKRYDKSSVMRFSCAFGTYKHVDRLTKSFLVRNF